jgi:hypothetical protein
LLSHHYHLLVVIQLYLNPYQAKLCKSLWLIPCNTPILISLYYHGNLITFSRLWLFTTFHRTQSFITIFTVAYHWILSWARQTQYTALASSTSVPSSHQWYGLLCKLLPSDFKIEILHAFIIYSKPLCGCNFVSFLNTYLHN